MPCSRHKWYSHSIKQMTIYSHQRTNMRMMLYKTLSIIAVNLCKRISWLIEGHRRSCISTKGWSSRKMLFTLDLTLTTEMNLKTTGSQESTQ